MIDIGVHILETSHSIIGTPKPISATGNTFQFLGNTKSDVKSSWAGWDYETYTVEDMAVGMIRFDTGTMLTIESSFVAHIPEDVFNIQIFGTKGGAVWDGSKIYTDYNNYMINASPAWITSPCREPCMTIPTAFWGKSLADDLKSGSPRRDGCNC
jgi:predicted dehydrogenase